jgi:hypothetical protein
MPVLLFETMDAVAVQVSEGDAERGLSWREI